MEITVILKQKIEYLPPVINLIDCLIDLGVRVNLICTELSDENYSRYSNNKIKICCIKIPNYRIRALKIFSILVFRKQAYHFIYQNNIGMDDQSYIWLGSAEAAMAMGHKIKKFRYIFQCHELYDKVFLYKRQNRFYFQNSLLNICPENNRASIFRYWYNLKQSPSLLVNSVYRHPQDKKMKIMDSTAATHIANLAGKKIILYMGIISVNRDISIFAEAIRYLPDNWHLLLMGNVMEGNETYLDQILQDNNKISYLSPLPAPAHLQVASWAHIGILSYAFSSLNNVFCAPNKIWEYAGFGIPVISNDNPGLTTLISKYDAGFSICFERTEKNIQVLVRTTMEIDANYESYRQHSVKLFSENNYQNQLQHLLNGLD